MQFKSWAAAQPTKITNIACYRNAQMPHWNHISQIFSMKHGPTMLSFIPNLFQISRLFDIFNWFSLLLAFQTQLSHGFPYADRRGDYSGSIGVNNPNRLHEHDPLALHQALQSAVDDGQNAGMDENAAFMSDLPLLKSELLSNWILYKCKYVCFKAIPPIKPWRFGTTEIGPIHLAIC